VLVDTLRRVGLRHSQFADASAQTIRLKLLKLVLSQSSSVAARDPGSRIGLLRQ
jgi:hypothetical protein